ncbi:conserved Plasmodium protein, unknown function [Plasmodium ovale wallikeri]|uniref:Poly(A) RNA polymerase mitochondrial-like central palm domain-containing protein n=1 Tax=Plasmodium ovale wallikeri TaxID=864142 RepID=A0A1A9A069_PLAOA|nr:conserved Plasmodium protein, unknown function [Plasmodium ovale wallikeri]
MFIPKFCNPCSTRRKKGQKRNKKRNRNSKLNRKHIDKINECSKITDNSKNVHEKTILYKTIPSICKQKKEIKNNPKLCKKEKKTNVFNNCLYNTTKNKNHLKSNLEIKKKEIVLENTNIKKGIYDFNDVIKCRTEYLMCGDIVSENLLYNYIDHLKNIYINEKKDSYMQLKKDVEINGDFSTMQEILNRYPAIDNNKDIYYIAEFIKKQYINNSLMELFKNIGQEVIYLIHLLKPVPHEILMRKIILEKLESFIKFIFPQFYLVIFGSCNTNLDVYCSDINICIYNNINADNSNIHQLYKNMKANNLFQNAHICIALEDDVEIIKCFFSEYKMLVHICFNSLKAIKSTIFIQNCLRNNNALKYLVIFFKLFLLQNGLNDISNGGISSFYIFLMLINFLKINEMVFSEKDIFLYIGEVVYKFFYYISLFKDKTDLKIFLETFYECDVPTEKENVHKVNTNSKTMHKHLINLFNAIFYNIFFINTFEDKYVNLSSHCNILKIRLCFKDALFTLSALYLVYVRKNNPNIPSKYNEIFSNNLQILSFFHYFGDLYINRELKKNYSFLKSASKKLRTFEKDHKQLQLLQSKAHNGDNMVIGLSARNSSSEISKNPCMNINNVGESTHRGGNNRCIKEDDKHFFLKQDCKKSSNLCGQFKKKLTNDINYVNTSTINCLLYTHPSEEIETDVCKNELQKNVTSFFLGGKYMGEKNKNINVGVHRTENEITKCKDKRRKQSIQLNSQNLGGNKIDNVVILDVEKCHRPNESQMNVQKGHEDDKRPLQNLMNKKKNVHKLETDYYKAKENTLKVRINPIKGKTNMINKKIEILNEKAKIYKKEENYNNKMAKIIMEKSNIARNKIIYLGRKVNFVINRACLISKKAKSFKKIIENTKVEMITSHEKNSSDVTLLYCDNNLKQDTELSESMKYIKIFQNDFELCDLESLKRKACNIYKQVDKTDANMHYVDDTCKELQALGYVLNVKTLLNNRFQYYNIFRDVYADKVTAPEVQNNPPGRDDDAQKKLKKEILRELITFKNYDPNTLINFEVNDEFLVPGSSII